MAKARRTTPLPRGWPAIRRAVLRRCDHRCEWTEDDGTRCRATATHADHVIPAWEGGGDHLDNLQGLCPPHHEAKTAREAGRARGVQKTREADRSRRPRELSPLEKMMREADRG